MASQEVRRHKLPGIDQTPPELIKAQGGKFRCEIRKLINSTGIRKNRLSCGRNRHYRLPMYTEDDTTDGDN
jgi:hypothetical protein